MNNKVNSIEKEEHRPLELTLKEEDGEDKSTDCAPDACHIQAVVKLTVCCLAGIVFGWCMEKSKVFEPASIRLQMVFERWIMLKMFLAAVASGQIVMGIISVIPVAKDRFRLAAAEYGATFKQKGLLTTISGPFILGIGMTLSGACPGMVLAQVGTWAKNAIYTFIGVLIGALLYGLVAPFVIKYTKPKKPFEVHTLHEKMNLPFVALAVPIGLVIALTVFLMEWFIPWEDDLDCWNRNSIVSVGANIFTMKSWPPSAGGGLIGLLQLVIIFAVGDTLGGSSSYVTIVSQWVIGKRLQSMFPYLANARCGIANWWQVFYVFSAVLGGMFSALASDSLAEVHGVSIASAICGGILLLLGARLAAGCTSGHGLSGVGGLFWLSFIAVPAMFAGAIATAFAMQATGALYDFHCPDVGSCPTVPTMNCTGF